MRRAVLIGLAAAGLAACAAVKPAQQEAVLRVEPRPPSYAGLKLPIEGGRLTLAPVTASATASGRRYAYIDPAAPREVRQAASLFWEEPPPMIVQRALERGLPVRLGVSVLTLAEASGGDRRLLINVDRFEEHAGASAMAYISVSATLIDGRSRDPIATGCYTASEPIPSAAPSDRAKAFETALGYLLDTLSRNLRQGSLTRQSGVC